MSSSDHSPGYVEGPRHAVVTPDDHGAILEIAAWILMVATILMTILRLFIRFTTSHRPGKDDTALSVATLFSIAQTITISIGVNDGLGKRSRLLTASQLVNIKQDVYAAGILYVVTIAIVKGSNLLLISRLATIRLHVIVIRGLSAVVLLWSVAAIFAVSFQCGLPHPWDYGSSKCFSTTTFWNVMGTFDILIDVALMALPSRVVWDLHMDWQRKLTVTSAFCFRIFAVIAQILRLIYIQKVDGPTPATYDGIAYHIATQCHMAVSIIVTVIPALKPFMDRAFSGFMGASLGQREGTYGASAATDSFRMHSIPGHKSAEANSGTNSSNTLPGPSRNRIAPMKPLSQSQASVRPFRRDTHSAVPQHIHKMVDIDVQYSDEQGLSPARPSDEQSADAISTRTRT